VAVTSANGTATAPGDYVALTPKGAGADLNLAWGKESWSVEITPAK
jgi:hypothetical protein